MAATNIEQYRAIWLEWHTLAQISTTSFEKRCLRKAALNRRFDSAWAAMTPTEQTKWNVWEHNAAVLIDHMSAQEWLRKRAELYK